MIFSLCPADLSISSKSTNNSSSAFTLPGLQQRWEAHSKQSIFLLSSVSLVRHWKGVPLPSSRGLRRTMYLLHRPQPKPQTLFPHCSLLLGRVLLPLLLLSQLKSKCLFAVNSLWLPLSSLPFCYPLSIHRKCLRLQYDGDLFDGLDIW